MIVFCKAEINHQNLDLHCTHMSIFNWVESYKKINDCRSLLLFSLWVDASFRSWNLFPITSFTIFCESRVTRQIDRNLFHTEYCSFIYLLPFANYLVKRLTNWLCGVKFLGNMFFLVYYLEILPIFYQYFNHFHLQLPTYDSFWKHGIWMVGVNSKVKAFCGFKQYGGKQLVKSILNTWLLIWI